MQTIPFILRPNKITVIINGETLNCTSDNAAFKVVCEAATKGDSETILKALKPAEAVKASIVGTDFTFDGSQVLYKGIPVVSAIATRMIWMIQNSFPVGALEAFYVRLQKNPSFRAVNELYGFLDACDLPITEDGYFMAYKKVRFDFLDIHSRTFDNSPGKVPEVPRNMVDEDPNNTCSRGLHVCSQSYLGSFASDDARTDKILMVKIDPADVVAVPTDYRNAKMRVCKYEVISEVEIGAIAKNYTGSKVAYAATPVVPVVQVAEKAEDIQIPLRDCKGRFLSTKVKEGLAEEVELMQAAGVKSSIIWNAVSLYDYKFSEGDTSFPSWFDWEESTEGHSFWLNIATKFR